jgi:hypothetical protein
MSESSLRQNELDVEEARARLAVSLAALRAPEAVASFKDDLKNDAIDTKNALLEQVQTSAQSVVHGLVEDLKAKAAANPAASLAIGAGLAWRLFHHPPVASALVGLGIFSLWRTNASRPPGSYRPDYLAEGKQRLREQAGEALAHVQDLATQGQTAVTAKASELAENAKDQARRWAHDASDGLAEMSSTSETKVKVEAIVTKANELLKVNASAVNSAIENPDARDKLLLGVAGLAVAAALGMACQRRLTEEST